MHRRCPKCGADFDHMVCDGEVRQFKCGTLQGRTRTERVIESEKCLRRQLAQAQEELQQALAREAELRRVVEKLQHIWAWFCPTRRPNEPDEAYQRRYDKFHELGEALDAALSSAQANPYAAVVEAAIAARDAFRLYDNPEKWHKAIAKLARVVEDLDPKLVVALDREEGRWRGVTQRQAERNLAVAAEQVLKAWDMGDDVSDAIEELREAALDYAAVEAGEPEFEVEVYRCSPANGER